MLYAIRASLPDRPGVLGAVATAIGSVPADIRSVSVVDHIGAYAVDEICVEADGTSTEALRSTIESLDGVVVEAVRRVGRIVDPLASLELAELLARGIGSPVDVLVTGLVRAIAAEWAMAIDASDGVRVLAATAGAPMTSFETPWLPLQGARRLGYAEWYPPRWRMTRPELAAAPLSSASTAVLVARPSAMSFRDPELRQLDILAGLATRAESRSAPALS